MKEKTKNIVTVIIAAMLVITTISASSFACISAANGSEAAQKISYSYEVK